MSNGTSQESSKCMIRKNSPGSEYWILFGKTSSIRWKEIPHSSCNSGPEDGGHFNILWFIFWFPCYYFNQENKNKWISKMICRSDLQLFAPVDYHLFVYWCWNHWLNVMNSNYIVGNRLLTYLTRPSFYTSWKETWK